MACPSLRSWNGWIFCLLLAAVPAQAAVPQQASESALAGIAFDDKPTALPMARNFQIAMNATAQELGAQCGTIESYGWKSLGQDRVNAIFTTTANRLKSLGYSVQQRSPRAVGNDVSVFTADRRDRNLMFMWSAGEVGMVLLICDRQSTAPAPQQTAAPIAASAATVPLEPEPTPAPEPVDPFPKFSPVGQWVGGYTCAQGYTGGTLTIARLDSASNISGTFRFYPTPQNPAVDAGKYYVSGQYDRISKRVLITPGAWIQHPKDYYQAIMVGRFIPERKAFSGVFQGINGCTSFEGKQTSRDVSSNELQRPAKKKKAKAKKKVLDDVKPVIIEGTAEAPKTETPTTPEAKSEVPALDAIAAEPAKDPAAEGKKEVPALVEPAKPEAPKAEEKKEAPAAVEPAKPEEKKETPAAEVAPATPLTKSVEDVLSPPKDMPAPPIDGIALPKAETLPPVLDMPVDASGSDKK